MAPPPHSERLNLGIALYGLRVGAATTVLTTGASFLVGCVVSIAGNMGLVHLGEYQPWLPIIGLEYGLVAGVIFGIVAAVVACQSRLRRTPSE